MDGQIGLLIPVEIQAPHLHPHINGRFEDTRQNFLPILSDDARDSNLHGNQLCVHRPPFQARGVQAPAAHGV
jgi:hypothetical protein